MYASDLVGINGITRVLLVYTCQKCVYPRGHVLPLRLPNLFYVIIIYLYKGKRYWKAFICLCPLYSIDFDKHLEKWSTLKVFEKVLFLLFYLNLKRLLCNCCYSNGIGLCPCGIGLLPATLSTPRWYLIKYGAAVKLCWQRKIKDLWEKSVALPFCQPQFPHWITWVRNRASVVRSRWLTAWAMYGTASWNRYYIILPKQSLVV
jgi:hypothetical protein